jgi:hypothetical protein
VILETSDDRLGGWPAELEQVMDLAVLLFEHGFVQKPQESFAMTGASTGWNTIAPPLVLSRNLFRPKGWTSDSIA